MLQKSVRHQSPLNLLCEGSPVFKLQANETLQNSTLSRTATDLLQAKRQIFTQQQQLQDYQKKEEDLQAQISLLQEKIRAFEMVRKQARG